MTSLANRLSTRKLKGPEKAPVQLTRGRIYILPTQHGYLFSLVLFGMLMGAINYNNSLAFGLTFLLVSMIIISMLHTHRNIADLRIQPANCKPVYAGDNAVFGLLLQNTQDKKRLAISIQAEQLESQVIDIPAHDTYLHHISIRTDHRGMLHLGRIKIHTDYPLGLLRAWAWAEPDTSCIVYPHPEENAPPPVFQEEGDGEYKKSMAGDDDFSGLRPYQKGDSLQRIAWKQSSWGDQLYTKEFSGGGTGKTLWLEWEQSGSMNTEHRLSRLCRWILDCDASGIPYGLKIPGTTLPPATGELHKHECLKALALFGREH
jgi:uncharacterized protein (DUF58 family)